MRPARQNGASSTSTETPHESHQLQKRQHQCHFVSTKDDTVYKILLSWHLKLHENSLETAIFVSWKEAKECAGLTLQGSEAAISLYILTTDHKDSTQV